MERDDLKSPELFSGFRRHSTLHVTTVLIMTLMEGTTHENLPPDVLADSCRRADRLSLDEQRGLGVASGRRIAPRGRRPAPRSDSARIQLL